MDKHQNKKTLEKNRLNLRHYVFLKSILLLGLHFQITNWKNLKSLNKLNIVLL